MVQTRPIIQKLDIPFDIKEIGVGTSANAAGGNQYYARMFDPTKFNAKTIKFATTLSQTNVGTYNVYAQLYDATHYALVTGTQLTANLAQYANSPQISGDIKANLFQGLHLYDLVIWVDAGGQVAARNACILVTI